MAKVTKPRRRQILQLICIALLAAFLCSVLIAEKIRVGAELITERATEITVTDSLPVYGYVFREELPVTSGNNGPVRYQAADGATVETGQTLAVVYPDDSNTGKRAAAARLTADEESLSALNAADPAWQPAFFSAYAEVMSRLSGGDLTGMNGSPYGMRQSLSVKDSSAADAGAREARIAELQLSFDELIKYVTAAGDELRADKAGRFCRFADGYETGFSLAAAEGLTPEGLEELLSSPLPTALSVGKVIPEGVWYLALPLSAAEAAEYPAGTALEASFPETGRTVAFLCESVNLSADGARAVLLLRAEAGTDPGDFCRRQKVILPRGSFSGLRIPAAALRRENGRLSVYVEVDGTARERQIRPVLDRDGYCLSQVTQDDGFLKPGEKILVTPRRLYEGKSLKST